MDDADEEEREAALDAGEPRRPEDMDGLGDRQMFGVVGAYLN